MIRTHLSTQSRNIKAPKGNFLLKLSVGHASFLTANTTISHREQLFFFRVDKLMTWRYRQHIHYRLFSSVIYDLTNLTLIPELNESEMKVKFFKLTGLLKCASAAISTPPPPPFRCAFAHLGSRQKAVLNYLQRMSGWEVWDRLGSDTEDS